MSSANNFNNLNNRLRQISQLTSSSSLFRRISRSNQADANDRDSHLTISIQPSRTHTNSSSTASSYRPSHSPPAAQSSPHPNLAYLTGPSSLDGLVTPNLETQSNWYHTHLSEHWAPSVSRPNHQSIQSSTTSSLTDPKRPFLAHHHTHSAPQLDRPHSLNIDSQFPQVDQMLTDATDSKSLPNSNQTNKPGCASSSASNEFSNLIQNITPSHSGSFGPVTFLSTPRGGPLPEQHGFKRKFRLFWVQTISLIVSNFFLISIVFYGLVYRFVNLYLIENFRFYLFLSRDQRNKFKQADLEKIQFRSKWENDQNDRLKKLKKEKVTKDFNYYAQNCGFEIVEQIVETLDGYKLLVWKVIMKNRPELNLKGGKGGYPVLIQHGLFQSAGSFITSEERSLAFWLVEHGGYQVYLGNNRGIFNMGHRKLKRDDPRFWDYNIKELALYDLPALVDHVLQDTGHRQLAFIGHSQGNATMFCSLAQGMVSQLGQKLSCFIALAPAVYAGPLTEGFPFGILKAMRWRTWRRVFGVLDFLPIMRWCVDWLPSSLFGFFGYQMFAFLFNWTDRNWLPRRKLKMFRFTPSPVSSAGIFWWTGYQGFSTRGCVLDPEVKRWWDDHFPPLALYHGGKDYLILVGPLLKRLETHEKSVKLIRNYRMEEGEHCDTFWHADAVELCFHLIIEDIESTRYDNRDIKMGESCITGDPVPKVLCEPSNHLTDEPERLLIDLSDDNYIPTSKQPSSQSLRQDEGNIEDDAMTIMQEDRDKSQAPMMNLERQV
ncbi:hypothetical protein O181_003516 [Austropuccinia psidii MF-1]|uniref:Partial AB-hydrolase lipase domain-containing protein n=1 Tax=Austropuccinia psidii MF-1 TaxID=1389203 RepID=A0A9Q3BDW4_9BASI|nr:hypothetical protein [Austropuccinia psidii MF-1]